MTGTWAILLLLGVAACDQAPGRRPESCKLPAQTEVILERDGAILETWALRLEDVAGDALPDDPAFLAYRAAIQRDSADVLKPVADPPTVQTDDRFNNELVFSGAVGSVDRISCLDALLLARQASRISQIDRRSTGLRS